MRGSGVFASALLLASTAWAQDTAVQTVLKASCAPCHNDSAKASGLTVTSREALLSGGNRGAAVKPGSPSDSLLLRAVEQSGDLKMPPGRKLPADRLKPSANGSRTAQPGPRNPPPRRMGAPVSAKAPTGGHFSPFNIPILPPFRVPTGPGLRSIASFSPGLKKPS